MNRAILGIVLIVMGGGLTWWSYAEASQGGTYVVWWGLILYGAYLLFTFDT